MVPFQCMFLGDLAKEIAFKFLLVLYAHNYLYMMKLRQESFGFFLQ